jgi:hypothetical protein
MSTKFAAEWVKMYSSCLSRYWGGESKPKGKTPLTPTVYFQHFTLAMYSNRLEQKRVLLTTVVKRLPRSLYVFVSKKGLDEKKLDLEPSEASFFEYFRAFVYCWPRLQH